MAAVSALRHDQRMRRKPYKKAVPASVRRHFIFEWRIYRGLSQEELAHQIRASAGTVSQIENGRQDYSQEKLEAIAAALGTDPASLLTRDPNDPEGIWAVWERVPPRRRAEAIEVLSILGKSDAAE